MEFISGKLLRKAEIWNDIIIPHLLPSADDSYKSDRQTAASRCDDQRENRLTGKRVEPHPGRVRSGEGFRDSQGSRQAKEQNERRRPGANCSRPKGALGEDQVEEKIGWQPFDRQPFTYIVGCCVIQRNDSVATCDKTSRSSRPKESLVFHSSPSR